MTSRPTYSYDSTLGRDALVQIPLPDRGGRYTPVPYVHIHDLLVQGLETRNLEITKSRVTLDKKGMRVFGHMTVQDGTEPEGFVRSVGWRSSHDGTLAIGFVGGVHVVVCSNLCFSGEVKEVRWHTRNVLRDLPMKVDAILDMILKGFAPQVALLNSLKGLVPETGPVLDHFMVELVRRHILGRNAMWHMFDEWKNPSYGEWKSHTDDLFGLLQACTHIMKSGTPVYIPERTTSLVRYMTKYFGVPQVGGLEEESMDLPPEDPTDS